MKMLETIAEGKDNDLLILNRFKDWVLSVDDYCCPKNPVSRVHLDFKSKGNILEYAVVDDKEFFIIYCKNLFKKIQNHKKKLFLFREFSENKFERVCFNDIKSFSNKDLFISISLREVRRRIRGETGILFNLGVSLNKRGNPLLYEIINSVNFYLKEDKMSRYEYLKEYESLVVESYFLSKLITQDLNSKLIEEVMRM